MSRLPDNNPRGQRGSEPPSGPEPPMSPPIEVQLRSEQRCAALLEAQRNEARSASETGTGGTNATTRAATPVAQPSHSRPLPASRGAAAAGPLMRPPRLGNHGVLETRLDIATWCPPTSTDSRARPATRQDRDATTDGPSRRRDRSTDSRPWPALWHIQDRKAAVHVGDTCRDAPASRVASYIPKPGWVCTTAHRPRAATRGGTAAGEAVERLYVTLTPAFPKFDGPLLRRSPLLDKPYNEAVQGGARTDGETGPRFLEQLDRALDHLFWPNSVVSHFGSENPLQRRIRQLERIVETSLSSRAAFRKMLAERACNAESLRTMAGQRQISSASREAQEGFFAETKRLQDAIQEAEEKAKSGSS
ncbi:hypothetical protein QBC39DRAFT_335555 [Podospora conica]|nr:hypothetical protein QBC39DRAFT_335555 [Schizothecium conicum]